MKRIIIFLILLFFVHILSAVIVGYEQAQQVAEHHLIIHKKTDLGIADFFEMKDENGKTLSYIFQLNPKGFIAVSSNTDIYPVIGYSFLNNFSDLDIPQNTGYQYLKQDMKLRLEAIPLTDENLKQSNRILWEQYLNRTYEQTQNRNNIYPPEGYSPTEGWIDTQWHQGEPYYNFCPLDPENMQRSIVGCGATALAQILHYHKYIGDVSFDDSDDYVSTNTYPYIYIDDDFQLYDFPSFPQLNPYLDELKIVYENYDLPTEDMIAALNFASGIPLEMRYSSSASSIDYLDIVAQAFLEKFNYDSAIFTEEINTNFYTTLQNDMIQARPVNIAAMSGPYYGHSFLCDGYNGNDNTFHLNMGWGGSSDGWYSLPENIPGGFTDLCEAVINIEGGTVPFTVSGAVVCESAPLEETIITFDGPRYHEVYLEDESGGFQIPILFPGIYTVTATIELEEGGYFHYQEDVLLDEDNYILIIEMDDYTTINGTVSADVNTENSHINIYQNDELVNSGVADENGDFSIPGLLPGDYTATASLNGNYFDQQEITITAENQNIDFHLEEYSYDFTFNFAGEASGQLQLFQFMSCAIRISGGDLLGHEDDIFSRVEFIAPFDPEEGELYAQIWKNENLVYEQQIMDFTEGEWLDVVFDDLFTVDVNAEYFIGYRIYSLSGNVSAAFHDEGPMIAGNGAYIYTSSWMPLPDSYDVNFCIKGIVASQSSMISSDDVINQTEFYLGKNYPNPFSTTTTIQFTTGNTAENTEILIYNVKGQKVRTFENLECINHVNAKATQSLYSITWNGKDDKGKSVNSGIYFYKLKSGNYEKAKKMILMR
ncbi:MAG TPA: T9SS type A sorting domain-containing protein [Candidatus Cloacimonetes bacterium]|nr:T9SS type A sorting domain-containing protein [Candidatus Cloacimonadota bacterium]